MSEIDRVVIEYPEKSLAALIVNTVILGGVLYTLYLALGSAEAISELSSSWTSLAVIIVMLILLFMVASSIFGASSEQLTIDENLKIEVLNGSTKTYSYKQVEKIEITRDSGKSTSLSLEIEIRDGNEWSFETDKYSMSALKAFFIDRGFACSEESKLQMTFQNEESDED